jgi:mannose-6-phosphate isomerase-like protein (cupin superfamily)
MAFPRGRPRSALSKFVVVLKPWKATVMWMHRVVSLTTGIAGVIVALAISPAAAAEKEALVILPDSGTHYAGPEGRESTVTEILVTRAQTGGALGLFRQIIPAQSGPPTHIHHDADEFFYVISGNFDFKLGDRIVNAPAGSIVFIPKGTVHTFKNTGAEAAVLLVGVTPAGLEQKFADWQRGDADTVKAMDKKYFTEVVGPPLK